VSPEIDEKDLNGTYFDPKTKIGKAEPWAQDKDGVMGKQMIAFSTAFCKEKVGVDFDALAKEALEKK
jgi:hypothetical protein